MSLTGISPEKIQFLARREVAHMLQVDALDLHIDKLDRQIAARHNLMTTYSEIKASKDPLSARKSRSMAGGDAGFAPLGGQAHQRNTDGAGDNRRGVKGNQQSSFKAKNGVTHRFSHPDMPTSTIRNCWVSTFQGFCPHKYSFAHTKPANKTEA